MNKKMFTPKEIGLPDFKKEAAIINCYTKICNEANALYFLFENFLNEECNVNLFVEFINSQNPREFLYSRFIELHNINIPGLSLEKIIQLDLVDVPKLEFDEILRQRERLLAYASKSEEYHFHFPLEKLYCNTCGVSDFGFTALNSTYFSTPEFDQKLFEYSRNFTESEKENELVEQFEKVVNSFNDLVESGLIRNDKFRWETDLNNILFAVQFNLNLNRPFSIKSNLFRLQKLNGIFQKFESSIPEEVEDVTLQSEDPANDPNQPQIENSTNQKESEIQHFKPRSDFSNSKTQVSNHENNRFNLTETSSNPQVFTPKHSEDVEKKMDLLKDAKTNARHINS